MKITSMPRSFSQHGAKTYVTTRNLDAVKALAQEIKRAAETRKPLK